MLAAVFCPELRGAVLQRGPAGSRALRQRHHFQHLRVVRLGQLVPEPGHLRVQRGLPEGLLHHPGLQPMLLRLGGGDGGLQQRAGVLSPRHHAAEGAGDDGARAAETRPGAHGRGASAELRQTFRRSPVPAESAAPCPPAV